MPPAVRKASDIIDLGLRAEYFEDDNKIKGFIDALYDEGKRQKWPFERQWYININFYLGRQYIIPNDVTKKFQTPIDPKWRVRHVNNMVRPFIVTKIAKLTRQEPQPLVVPATGDYDDIQKARLCESLLEYWWSSMHMQDMLANGLYLWEAVCGNSFLKVCWNPQKGKVFRVEKDEVDDEAFEEMTDAAYRSKDREKTKKRAEKSSAIEGFEGEVDLRVVAPFSMFFHPNAKYVEDSLWALESTVKDIDSVREEWGDAADEIQPDSDADTTWNDYEERLLGNDMFSPFGRGPKAHFPKIIEKQFYLKPCRKFPEGKYIVVAGGIVLHNGPFPYDHGQLPFIHFRDSPVPGRFWAQSVIEDCIPVQKAYNSMESKKQEVFNLHSKPQWLNPKGSGASPVAFSSSPGNIIDFIPPNAPTRVEPPSMPAYTSELLDRQIRSFENITGQHEPSKGMAPGRVDSASGIVALQEADDTRLGPLNKHNQEQLAKAGSQMLAVAKQFYQEQRLIQIVGPSGFVEVKEFLGSELTGAGYNGQFDVRVQTGSSLPLSPTARQQYVMQLAQSGILDPKNPDDKEMILTILELGGPKSAMFQDTIIARVQAHIENMELSHKQMHSVNTWDDDAAHILVHEAFRRRPEFLDEAKKDPTSAAYFEMHIRMHEAAQVVKGMKQQQLVQQLNQAMQGGGAPQAGGMVPPAGAPGLPAPAPGAPPPPMPMAG